MFFIIDDGVMRSVKRHCRLRLVGVTSYLLWAILCYCVCTCLVNLQLFKKEKERHFHLWVRVEGTGLKFCAFNTREKKIHLIILVLFLWVLLLKGVGFL